MRFQRPTPHVAAAALALLVLFPKPAVSLPAHNVPGGAAIGHYEGRVDPGKEMNLTIVLKMHDRAGFDNAVEELYDPASSKYHQWFTDKDFEKYAPTPQEFETVKKELVRQGFTVVSSDPRRLSLRVHGTAAIVEKAFNTELNNYSYKGSIFQANARDAHLAGPADDLIGGVAGIERHRTQPQLSRVLNPVTGKPAFRKELSNVKHPESILASFTDTPLTWSSTPISLTTPGASLPTATYTGYQYGANGLQPGFTPAQLQEYYGVPFKQGGVKYDGTGQTIALVDAYGYPDAGSDAGTAAKLFGLTPLTSGDFKELYPEGKPLNPNAGVISGWDGEIALDIQSAHAIAPGAKILLVASSGEDDEDQIASLNWIITGKEASVVSNSWEVVDPELLVGVDEEEAFTTVLEAGAAAGIAIQFSTGDGGDNGFGTPIGTNKIPSNSPYATAVGGTSVLNNPNPNANPWIVTGWGNNEVELYYLGVEDPLEGFFAGGAGGGESQYFTKPAFQHELPGSWRRVPDVSALADPYTGFMLVLTEGGKQYVEVYGGTSLASPIFTATWAIAGQYNGSALGQAAPAVSKLKSGEITDVVAPSSKLEADDAAGSITDSKGTHTYNRTTIFTHATDEDAESGDLSLYSQKAFLSAIWPISYQGVDYAYVALSFGTDTSLTVTSGWDDVTGWGEPNGSAFIQGVTGKTTGAGEKEK
jgi:subtilase family serine protease